MFLSLGMEFNIKSGYRGEPTAAWNKAAEENGK